MLLFAFYLNFETQTFRKLPSRTLGSTSQWTNLENFLNRKIHEVDPRVAILIAGIAKTSIGSNFFCELQTQSPPSTMSEIFVSICQFKFSFY